MTTHLPNNPGGVVGGQARRNIAATTVSRPHEEMGDHGCESRLLAKQNTPYSQHPERFQIAFHIPFAQSAKIVVVQQLKNLSRLSITFRIGQRQ